MDGWIDLVDAKPLRFLLSPALASCLDWFLFKKRRNKRSVGEKKNVTTPEVTYHLQSLRPKLCESCWLKHAFLRRKASHPKVASNVRDSIGDTLHSLCLADVGWR